MKGLSYKPYLGKIPFYFNQAVMAHFGFYCFLVSLGGNQLGQYPRLHLQCNTNLLQTARPAVVITADMEAGRVLESCLATVSP